MEPSARTPNVLLFSSEAAGAEFGYKFDGWHSDGTFHFTGEGQVGDQTMREGNKALRDHAEKGRAVRLFEKRGTDVQYVGEFKLPDSRPWFIDEAPDRNGELRSVFVFRLQPVGEVWRAEAPATDVHTSPRLVPIEASNIEEYVRQRLATELEPGLRRESALVARYIDWLNVADDTLLQRHLIPTPGGRPMFTDVYNTMTGQLIEAKASSAREHIRLALGQLLDYARFVHPTGLAVLVPTEPAEDLIALLLAQGIGCIWEDPAFGFDQVHPTHGLPE